MKIVILDGERIPDAAAMHAVFARDLDLPAWYGANLDALHDVLTETTEEIGVITVHSAQLARNLGRRWHPLLRLFAELKSSRPGFDYSIDPVFR